MISPGTALAGRINQRPRQTHENHEWTIMILLRRRRGEPGQARLGAVVASAQGVDMIWQTPVAIDFRFGMEITMYVSHR